MQAYNGLFFLERFKTEPIKSGYIRLDNGCYMFKIPGFINKVIGTYLLTKRAVIIPAFIRKNNYFKSRVILLDPF